MVVVCPSYIYRTQGPERLRDTGNFCWRKSVIPEKSVTDTAVTLLNILKKIRVFVVIYKKSLRLLIMKKWVSVAKLENVQQVINKFQKK
jgi:hypothetical protein